MLSWKHLCSALLLLPFALSADGAEPVPIMIGRDASDRVSRPVL